MIGLSVAVWPHPSPSLGPLFAMVLGLVLCHGFGLFAMVLGYISRLLKVPIRHECTYQYMNTAQSNPTDTDYILQSNQ